MNEKYGTLVHSLLMMHRSGQQ